VKTTFSGRQGRKNLPIPAKDQTGGVPSFPNLQQLPATEETIPHKPSEIWESAPYLYPAARSAHDVHGLPLSASRGGLAPHALG
jgi:hypothetical protein